MFSVFSKLTDQFKLVIVSILVTLLVTSSLGAWYINSKYEKTLKQLTSLQSQFQQISTELTTCSSNIEKISDASVDKMEKAKKAVSDANIQDKKHQSISTKILSATPSSSDSCASSLALFEQYLSKDIK